MEHFPFPLLYFQALQLDWDHATCSVQCTVKRSDVFTSRPRQLEQMFPLHPFLPLCSDPKATVPLGTREHGLTSPGSLRGCVEQNPLPADLGQINPRESEK